MENEKQGAAEAFGMLEFDLQTFFFSAFEIALANIFSWLEILQRVKQTLKKKMVAPKFVQKDF